MVARSSRISDSYRLLFKPYVAVIQRAALGLEEKAARLNWRLQGGGRISMTIAGGHSLKDHCKPA